MPKNLLPTPPKMAAIRCHPFPKIRTIPLAIMLLLFQVYFPPFDMLPLELVYIRAHELTMDAKFVLALDHFASAFVDQIGPVATSGAGFVPGEVGVKALAVIFVFDMVAFGVAGGADAEIALEGVGGGQGGEGEEGEEGGP